MPVAAVLQSPRGSPAPSIALAIEHQAIGRLVVEEVLEGQPLEPEQQVALSRREREDLG